jgi:DNA-binding Lrp family transcriptional regulator
LDQPPNYYTAFASMNPLFEPIATFISDIHDVPRVRYVGLDYLMRIFVEGLDAYENFIRNRIHPIGGIGSIDTSFVYGTIKKSNIFPKIG